MIEKLRQRISENPVRYLILSFILIIVFLLMIISANSSGPLEEGDLASPTSGAFLVYDGAPYLPFSSTVSNNMLQDDIAYYARSVFPDNYNPEKQPAVVFNVSGKPNQNEKLLDFEGGFEKAKGKFKITVELLNFGKIKTSITNIETNQNIDSELPSSSKQNQFIGSLPITTNAYTISFSGTNKDNKISIRLNDRAAEYRTEALGVVETALGSEFINDNNISLFYLQIDEASDRGEYVRIYISGEMFPVETNSISANEYEEE